MSYGRRLNLKVGDIEIDAGPSEALRVAFDITRDKTRDPNDATIQVWNLAATTRAKFENAERVFCELSAGYADESVHRLFSGVLLDAHSSRDGPGSPDFVTTFSLGDDAEQKAAILRFNRTFPTGTQVATVLRELVRASGLAPGNLTQLASKVRLQDSATLKRPWTASGSALQNLHNFARSVGYQYTIQNQEVRFLGLEPATGGLGPLITSENVADVSLDDKGLASFTCRLLPDLLPGSPFRLETSRVSGDYVAVATHHFGDTHGGDWAVDVQGELISAMIERTRKEARVKVNK